MPTDPLV